MITNTTYRFLVEKLGDSDPAQFVGNEGEVFYDPTNPILKLSNGSTPGGVSVGGEGGGGGNANTGNIVFDGNDIINEDDINITSGDDLRITANDVLQLRTETDDVDIIVNYDGEDEKRWTFNRDGNLELPSGGDIVDDEGNSVFGGGITEETDPVFSASVAFGITSNDTSNWDAAYGWGDHSAAGYLTSFEETDPVFSASDAAGIISSDISNWDTAYGWGDHSAAGYISSTSTSYAQTLIVDPNGDDNTANGGPNAPFQTLQAAHDYAASNNSASEQVIIKLNGGTYSGNLLVTRPNTHFIGPNYGQTKSTRLAGIVTVSTASSVSGTVNDMVTFENMLIATGTNSGTSVVTIGGTIGCSVFMKDVYVFTSSTSAKCLDVTNTVSGGVQVEIKNVVLQNQSSSGTTINLSNTYYANIDLLTIFGGTGPGMDISTTNAVVYNTRFENVGVSTTSAVINVLSSFAPGQTALVLGNSTIANPSANGNGIDIAANAITNVAQVAFNVGTSVGTGFAVKGVLGSVFVNGNNLIVPGTNNKVSTAIGAGNIPLGTSLTPA
jgi:hypothetical protein